MGMCIENGTYKGITMFKTWDMSDNKKFEGIYDVEVKDGKARVFPTGFWAKLSSPSRWNKPTSHGGASTGKLVTGVHYELTVNGQRVHFYLKLENKTD